MIIAQIIIALNLAVLITAVVLVIWKPMLLVKIIMKVYLWYWSIENKQDLDNHFTPMPICNVCKQQYNNVTQVLCGKMYKHTDTNCSTVWYVLKPLQQETTP